MKKILLSIALCLSLNADINQAVQGILGNSEYNTHRNLVNRLFQNQNEFYTNGRLDYTKVSQTLQNNNLLKLNLGGTQNIDVTFIFNSSPKKSFRNINDILKAIGQQNFITTNQVSLDNQLKWSIKVQTAAAINPLRLSRELQSVNCQIIDIKKEGNNKWSYYIDSSKSSIYKAEDLVTKASTTLRKPIKPYILEISNTDRLSISSNNGSNWYPSITFYDNDFSVIEVFEDSTLHKNLQVDVPNDTKFVKIDDFYALTNIRNGLTVTKE
ncbi:hypothetical protein [Aliarcobacter lanthieri]|uniref:hypothetical protein n=1 Tax=Aliarcobacter lanthieri TaxID=1355374 RepID=UPI003AADCB38